MKTKESKETVEAFNKYLVDGIDTEWRKNNAWRKANKAWLKKSAKIALKINRFLRDHKITQKQLAAALGVTPQQVNKILKGRENFKLETIAKIETVLGVELISILKEDEVIIKKNIESVVYITKEILRMEYSKHDVIKSENTFKRFEPIHFEYKELGSLNEYTTTTVKPKAKSLEVYTAEAA